jgi:hypothetical protein
MYAKKNGGNLFFSLMHISFYFLCLVSSQCNDTELMIESKLFTTINIQSPGYSDGYERYDIILH